MLIIYIFFLFSLSLFHLDNAGLCYGIWWLHDTRSNNIEILRWWTGIARIHIQWTRTFSWIHNVPLWGIYQTASKQYKFIKWISIGGKFGFCLLLIDALQRWNQSKNVTMDVIIVKWCEIMESSKKVLRYDRSGGINYNKLTSLTFIFIIIMGWWVVKWMKKLFYVSLQWI